MPLNRRIFTLKASELRTEVHSSVPEKSLALPLESDSHASSAISCRRQMAATIRVRSIWAVATVTFALVAGSLSWASEPATSPEAAFVQKTISSHKIVIFSKSYCPYSNKAKGVFKELNQVPHVIELDQRDDGQSIQDALNEIVGKRTVPQVFIDGKHLGGSDATVEAYESGELAKLLGIAISPEAAFINETIASHRIVIFSKSYCPYCKKAKGVFKELNQVPHVVELDQRDDGQAIQDAMSEIVGKRSVPQVFIDGKHIGGSDATVEAYESGELAKLLGIATSKAAFVKETISSHKIVIFSKSYCPYCKKAKGVFKELDQAPHIIELDQREDGQDIQDALSEIVGRRTVPQVFIDGKHLGGSDDTVQAYESGELAKLLGIAVKNKEEL